MVRLKWTWLISIVLVIGLVVASHSVGMLPSYAQVAPLEEIGEANVVVDGNVIFTIKDTEKFTANQRAKHINDKLIQEVKSPKKATITVTPNRSVTPGQQRNQIYLRSQTQDILLTLTDADVTLPGSDRREQAEKWAKDLQRALRRGQQERTLRYQRQAATYSAFILGGAIVLHCLFWFLSSRGDRYLHQWFEYSSQQFKEWEKPVKLFWQLGSFVLKAGLWLTVIFYITDVFPQARSLRYDLITILNAEILTFGDVAYSALTLIRLVLGAVALWFGSNVLTYLFRTYVLHQARLEQGVQDILSVLIQWALMLLGVVILLQVSGIDYSSLTILASLLGVGIGFGVQNITNNFISGFIITLERPIQVGDFINVGDRVGTVVNIGARSTELRTLDQVTIIIPNSRFLESEVINWSHGNSVSRLHIPVGVAYGSDIALVKQTLLGAVRQHPEVLFTPKPDVFFQGFGDSSLNFEVLVWTGEPRKQAQVRSDLNYDIEASLRRHGIEIPFPQRDLHVRSPQLEELVGILRQSLMASSPTDNHPIASPTPPSTDNDPSVQNPSVQDPSVQDPSVQDPSVQDPSVQDPSAQDPSDALRLSPNTSYSSAQDPSDALRLSPNTSYSSSLTNASYPSSPTPSPHHPVTQSPHHPVTPSPSYPVTPSPHHPITHPPHHPPSQVSPDLDLEALLEAMQAPEGIELRDRSYGSRTYPACFTGTDAVDWLMQQREYTSQDALLIGQWLLQQGFIHRIIGPEDAETKGFDADDRLYQFQREDHQADHLLP